MKNQGPSGNINRTCGLLNQSDAREVIASILANNSDFSVVLSPVEAMHLHSIIPTDIRLSTPFHTGSTIGLEKHYS